MANEMSAKPQEHNEPPEQTRLTVDQQFRLDALNLAVLLESKKVEALRFLDDKERPLHTESAVYAARKFYKFLIEESEHGGQL